MATTDTAQPSVTQLVEAFAAALLPLAGPGGLIASNVMTAALQFMANLQSTYAGGNVFTMDQLQAAADKTTSDLAQLAADIDAQQAGQPGTLNAMATRSTIPTRPRPGDPSAA